MIAFIDDHRDAYGVKPICRVLPIAPSAYHERVAQGQDPTRLAKPVFERVDDSSGSVGHPRKAGFWSSISNG